MFVTTKMMKDREDGAPARDDSLHRAERSF